MELRWSDTSLKCRGSYKLDCFSRIQSDLQQRSSNTGPSSEGSTSMLFSIKALKLWNLLLQLSLLRSGFTNFLDIVPRSSSLRHLEYDRRIGCDLKGGEEFWLLGLEGVLLLMGNARSMWIAHYTMFAVSDLDTVVFITVKMLRALLDGHLL